MEGQGRFYPLRRESQAPALAGACALVAVAATAEIVLDGAIGHSPLIPKSPSIAGWLPEIGERLGFRVFLIAIIAFTLAYCGVRAMTSRIPTSRSRFRSRFRGSS